MPKKIDSQLSFILGLLEKQTKGTRKIQKRHHTYEPIKIASNVTQERKSEGYRGKSDQDEELPEEERKQVIQQTLTEEGATQQQAELIAAKIVEEGLKYEYHDAYLDTPDFFSVKSKGGAIIVTLNNNHPAYKNLVEILENDVEPADIDTLRSRLLNSLKGLKLLLMAWARYEDEQPDSKAKQTVQQVRFDWGLIAKRFLENE